MTKSDSAFRRLLRGAGGTAIGIVVVGISLGVVLVRLWLWLYWLKWWAWGGLPL